MKRGKSLVVLFVCLILGINFIGVVSAAVNTRVQWKIPSQNMNADSAQGYIYIKYNGNNYQLNTLGELIGNSGTKVFSNVNLSTGKLWLYTTENGDRGTGCYRNLDEGCLSGPMGPYTDNSFTVNPTKVYAWAIEDKYCPPTDSSGLCNSMYRGDILSYVSMETYNTCTPKTCVNYSGQCGSALNDGCGGTINCGCTGTEICNSTTPGVLGVCTPDVCPADQVIMKLFSQNNSHGALSDNTVYTNDICYSAIFGTKYTGANPHDCKAGNANKVIGLYQDSNSHGQIPSLNNYNIPVCYGELACHSESGTGTSCTNSDEKVVLRLSYETNAHISNANNTNAPIKICCGGSNLNNANWTNMEDQIISKADMNDSVKLMVLGVGMENVNYTIYKDGAYWWGGDKVVAQTSTKGYLVWQAKNSGTYYFKAQVGGSSNWKQSNNLVVSSLENNSNPTIKIIKPAAETTYVINSTTGATVPVSFEQISSDEDDDLSVTWDFGENQSLTISNCTTNGDCNTTYAYNNPGTKLVKATAKEILRENKQSAIDLSRIFVYKEGLNLFAIIDSPDYKTIIQEIGNYFVDGRSSHVANCSFDLNKCTAGASPKTCYTITDSVTSQNIYCYKFAESSDNRFGFKWTIENKVDNEHTNFRYFNKSFVIPKDYPINLRVNFTF